MTRSTNTPHVAGEAGFTLIELIVSLVIVSILMATAVVMLTGSKVTQRDNAMASATATFQGALAEYMRSYPVGGTVPDALASRGGYVGPWSPEAAASNTPATGIFGVGGDAIIKEWPVDPFHAGHVMVTRGNCSGPAIEGHVSACWADATKTTVRVVGWGLDPKTAAPKVVFDSVTCRGRCPFS